MKNGTKIAKDQENKKTRKRVNHWTRKKNRSRSDPESTTIWERKMIRTKEKNKTIRKSENKRIRKQKSSRETGGKHNIKMEEKKKQ